MKAIKTVSSASRRAARHHPLGPQASGLEYGRWAGCASRSVGQSDPNARRERPPMKTAPLLAVSAPTLQPSGGYMRRFMFLATVAALVTGCGKADDPMAPDSPAGAATARISAAAVTGIENSSHHKHRGATSTRRFGKPDRLRRFSQWPVGHLPVRRLPLDRNSYHHEHLCPAQSAHFRRPDRPHSVHAHEHFLPDFSHSWTKLARTRPRST